MDCPAMATLDRIVETWSACFKGDSEPTHEQEGLVCQDRGIAIAESLGRELARFSNNQRFCLNWTVLGASMLTSFTALHI